MRRAAGVVRAAMVAGLMVVGLMAASGAAWAAPTDLVTGSVGTQFGVSSFHQLDDSSTQRFVSELQVRGRFLYALGVELTYNPAATGADNQELVFNSQFRLATQIYFLPLDFMSMYLTFGIGANHMGDLFSIVGDTNTYHGGIGAEVYVWDNLAVGAEWLMIIPGVRSIQKTVVTHALSTAFATEDQTAPTVDVNKLSPWDFVHPRNFQLTVGARYYF